MSGVCFCAHMKQRKPGFWFQLSREERDEWKEIAVARNTTVSELIRSAVAEKLKRLKAKQKAPAGSEAA